MTLLSRFVTTSLEAAISDTIKTSYLSLTRPYKPETVADGPVCCTEVKRARALYNIAA
jgi:hypothetical protein